HLNKNGVRDLEVIGLSDFFDFPKPKSLMTELTLGATFFSGNNQDIILDFFAGSATTAHAVMDLNKEDGGNRKYICVQLPEPTDEESDAYKAGYKSIAEISKERIRRASAKIKAEAEAIEKTDLLSEDKAPLDLGFRVFKLQKSNFSVWNSTHTTDPTQIALQLEQHIDHIAPEASQQAILFELLIKSGYELTTPITTLTLADKTVYSIADNALLICLEKELTIEVMNAIAALEPSRVIVLDEGFQNND
ncbi:DNA methyltransferase, partial [Rhizobium hidalgonense]